MIRYSKFCIAIEFSLIRCTWITWWIGKCWIFMRDWCYLLSRNIWIRANWWMIGCWRDWWFIRFHRNGIFYWIGDGRRIIHWLIWRVRHLRRILTHRIGRMVWHWTCSCWHSLLMWRIGREFSRDKPLFHWIINILNTSKISRWWRREMMFYLQYRFALGLLLIVVGIDKLDREKVVFDRTGLVQCDSRVVFAAVVAFASHPLLNNTLYFSRK